MKILSFRLICYLLVGTGLFYFGRYSAHGASRQIPMTVDQFLVGMGMVKAATETLKSSQSRLLDIAESRTRGRYTSSQAEQLIKAEQERQEGQVAAAVSSFLNASAQIGNTFTVPPGELPEPLLNTIEYVQTKYPSLFTRYMGR